MRPYVRIALEALKSRIRERDEMSIHNAFQDVLRENDIEFTREAVIARNCRVDFLLDTTAVEFKVHGSAIEVMRQLHRYSQSRMVREIVLVTMRNVHRLMPAKISGKPVEVFILGGFLS